MTKILSWVFGILLAVAIIFGGQTLWTKWQLQDTNDALNEQLMKANLEIGKAKTDFGNAEKKIGELDEALQNALKKNGETLTAYGELKAKYELLSTSQGDGNATPGDTVEPGEDYEPGMWYAAISKKELAQMPGLSIASFGPRVDFDLNVWANMDPSDPFSFKYDVTHKIHLTLKMQLVETLTNSGAVNRYANIFDIGVDDTGKELVFGKYQITDFEYIVQKPKQKEWFLWSPHIDIGAFLGVNTSLSFAGGASFGFTTSGYGLTKNDLTWKFARIGVDITEGAIGLSFSPAQYNLGEVLPLISNLYVGPYVSAMTDGHKNLGLLLTVGL